MTDQMMIQNILRERFTELQCKNTSFSLRAYAKKLNISPSALSEILNGKRFISKKLAKNICDKLLLSPEESQHVLSLFPDKKSKLGKLKNNSSIQLTIDQFYIISDWYHFAIISLLETEKAKDDPSWIAKRLGIKTQEARTALERLERLEMLERDNKDKLKPTGTSFCTTDGISNTAIRKSHSQSLDLAKRSLDEDDVSIRNFSNMTMAIDPQKLPTAKKMINQFQNTLCAFLESGEKKEVYNISVQLFPITKIKEKN